MKTVLTRACFGLVLCLAVAVGASAQQIYGQIRGTVTDPSGESIPGAVVVATNTATGIQTRETTAVNGAFHFLQLAIGPYRLSFSHQGFRTVAVKGIVLTVDLTFVQNAKLEVGSQSQQVNVSASPVQVETSSMQLSSTVNSSTIESMPLNGRDWTQLQQLAPGVVSSGSGGPYATNGSQAGMNSYLINGTDSDSVYDNSAEVVPSPDAIAQFQMVTSTMDAQFGRDSGAVINAAIKSGTNQFHGDLFEFFRNTSLNARDFFQTTASVFDQNQFGGTIGGPISKDHTFFFFSYQGTRYNQTQGFSVPDVPTAAEAGGDFSSSAAVMNQSTNVSPIPLYGDSASSCPAGGSPCAAGTPYGTAGVAPGSGVRPLFSTGVIPGADFNVASKALMKYIPSPNLGANGYTFNPIETGTDNQELFRIDHHFSQSDQIWWYSLFESKPVSDTLSGFGGATLPGFGGLSQTTTQQHTFAWTHVFSANALNQFHLGYTRSNQRDGEPTNTTQASAVGFTGINPQVPQYGGIPEISVAGGDVNFQIGSSQYNPSFTINNTYELTDNFSKIAGRHDLSLGFEATRFLEETPYYGLDSGDFTYNGAGQFSTGLPMADFLLGFPDTYQQDSGGFIAAGAWEIYSFAQDQFKMRPDLMLTGGLSWDIETPLTDWANGGRAIDCFRPGQQSTIYPTAPSGLLVPGDSGCTSSGYSTYYGGLSPRIGFAWSPNWGRISGGPGKFSIRGGVGIYYNRSLGLDTLQNLSDPPFQVLDFGVTDAGGVPSFNAPYTDVRCMGSGGSAIPCSPTGAGGVATPSSIPNKYPFLPPAAGSNINFNFFEPMSLNVIDPTFRAPYAENYNLTVERQLPGQVILSVAYVGSMGHHLVVYHELNPGINPQGCASNTGAEAGCPANALLQYALYPQNFAYNSRVYGSIGDQSSMGNSNYNSLQISVRNATSHGLSFGLAYTYSHALDNAPQMGIDPFNYNRFYGDSNFDAPQRLVAHYTYALPFRGNGKLGNALVSGWHIAGITTLQMGTPIHITDLADGFYGVTSLTCPGFASFYECWDVPNVDGAVTSLDPRTSSRNEWFNPATFSAPALGTMGDVGRSVINGPGMDNWDIQISKDIATTENTHMELRGELFNAFNHAQFANPDGNFGDGRRFGT
ncbi:MAG: carboxypeptidase regulatory-like domain-containing protein, partial [Terriglobales bacterium]